MKTIAITAVTAALIVGSGAAAFGAEDGHTRFGTTVQRCHYSEKACISLSSAVARQEAKYGHLGIVRLYYTGLPPDWDDLPARPLMISWRIPPAMILSGKEDTYFRHWFAAAPTRPIYWSYWHEADQDITKGYFSADAYRKAFAHLIRLGGQARRLHPTQVLMHRTLVGKSGHPWRYFFYSGVQVLGFEAYSRTTDRYTPARSLLEPAWKACQSVHKQWATPELGAVKVTGDDGSGRATWLKSAATYATEHDSKFMSYLDNTNGTEGFYRLNDRPSRTAWRQVVTDALAE